MGKKVFIGRSGAEIIEKKSRFIGTVFEVHSEEEALKIIESVRKQYWDARHNCFAYVLGPDNEIQRFSDDKEPQGSAGRPILDVLSGNGIHNALIVVTRYFGGILLGTGGLARAYSLAANEALKAGSCLEAVDGFILTIKCDYVFSGKISYILKSIMDDPGNSGRIGLKNTAYNENVVFEIVADEKAINVLNAKITEATSGKAVTEKKDAVTFSVKDGIPVLYSF